MTTVAYAVPSVQRIGRRISCEAVQAPGSAAISCRVAVSADRRRAAPPRRARARGAYLGFLWRSAKTRGVQRAVCKRDTDQIVGFPYLLCF